MPDRTLRAEIEELQRRLQEAEDTIQAIRAGAVDGFVVDDPHGQGPRIYTLEGAERPYRILVEQMQQGAATLTSDGRIAYCNRCLAELVDIPHERVVGLALVDLVADSDRPACETLFREAAAGASQIETSLRSASGEVVPVLLTLNTMPPEGGAAFGLLVTDLTSQRHQERLLAALGALRTTEEALRQVAADLSAANRRKDEFLATLAHELRNPLAPISAALQVMRLARDDATEVERARQIAERQVRHMVRLVDDLLDVSRITQDKLQLRKQKVTLADVVRNAVEANQSLIDAGRHKLTVSLPAGDLWLDVDPARMTQVLANLLNNASKYTKENGRIWLTASVDERSDGRSELVVRVGDTGIGIPDDMLPRIFDMFTQVDSTLERAQGGLGIGLTLVKRLMEMHGGSVEATSAGCGQGSEFVVRLAIDVSAGLRRGAEPSVDAPPVAPLHVLVVDDNPDAAESLAQLLRLMGHDVDLAGDGRAALELAKSREPDLVLMDIGLPGMSGYDVARRMRGQPRMRGTTLVAVTGWGQDEDRRRAMQTGFDHHLTKPVETATLEKLLSSVRSRRNHAMPDENL